MDLSLQIGQLYIPLFTASDTSLWQTVLESRSVFFFVSTPMVSLGVLLREPFLPFFLLAGIAIWIGYGWRVLLKYLIGSAILGFSVLAVVLSFRGWDLLDLINSYLFHQARPSNLHGQGA